MFKLFKKPWWTPNKKSRKSLREEADRLIGYDKTINRAWGKTWKYFIKRQFPWYGLIELNQFKIIEMRDYVQNKSWIEDEEIAKQVKQMNEVIELGDKILLDEYQQEALAWVKTNRVSVTIVYEKFEGHFRSGIGKELVRLYNHNIIEDIARDLNLADNNTNLLLSKYLEGKETRDLTTWLKDNNLSKKNIITAYTSEWINGQPAEENREKYIALLNQAEEDRKADISKYFECIGEYQDEWGD